MDVLRDSVFYDFVATWGGVLFFLISGICATLGSRPVRRGVLVIACGLVVSAVTYGMYAFSFATKDIIIYFGVLHCLGTCMLLWPLFRQLPWPVLLLPAAAAIYCGFLIDKMSFDTGYWLIPLGFKFPNFQSSDYFPLLPYFGYFLIGAVLGSVLYKNKASLFPRVSENNFLVKFFSFFGKWSLFIYMLHQPIFTGILTLLEVIL